MNVNCPISGVLQKQVKRHDCEIPVKFPCSRGAWRILSLHFLAGSHHLRHISRSPLQSTAWDPAVEERWFLTVGQESWLQIGQQRFIIFSPLLFLIYFNFKEQYFRWLVSYFWKECKCMEGENQKRFTNLIVIKMSQEVYYRYTSFRTQSCLCMTSSCLLENGSKQGKRRFFFFF